MMQAQCLQLCCAQSAHNLPICLIPCCLYGITIGPADAVRVHSSRTSISTVAAPPPSLYHLCISNLPLSYCWLCLANTTSALQVPVHFTQPPQVFLAVAGCQARSCWSSGTGIPPRHCWPKAPCCITKETEPELSYLLPSCQFGLHLTVFVALP